MKKKATTVKKQRVARTRNAGTLTESAFWGMIRSKLRSASQYWKPAINAKLKARKVYIGTNKSQKWEYLCSHCKKYYKDKEVNIHHVIPCGELKSGKDLQGFVERLFCENGYEILCKKCHIETHKK